MGELITEWRQSHIAPDGCDAVQEIFHESIQKRDISALHELLHFFALVLARFDASNDRQRHAGKGEASQDPKRGCSRDLLHTSEVSNICKAPARLRSSWQNVSGTSSVNTLWKLSILIPDSHEGATCADLNA